MGNRSTRYCEKSYAWYTIISIVTKKSIGTNVSQKVYVPGDERLLKTHNFENRGFLSSEKKNWPFLSF